MYHGPEKLEDFPGYSGVEGLDMATTYRSDKQLASVNSREWSYACAFLARVTVDPQRIARLVTAKVVNMWQPTWAKFRFRIWFLFAAYVAQLLVTRWSGARQASPR